MILANQTRRLLFLLQSLLFASTSFGQAASDLPRAEYYAAKGLYGSGRIPAAVEGFEIALKRARQVGDQRWIDSIPPLVMLGECYYQQGSLAAALEQYDRALMLALTYPDWMDRIEVADGQLPPLEKVPKGIDWFPKSQGSQPVVIPEAIQVAIDPTQTQPDGQGGVVAPVSLVTRLDATEVFQTLGLAMLRRQQILGPLAKRSPLTAPLVELFRQEPRQPVAWVQGAWRVLRGISQLSTQTAQAAPATIRSGILLNNQFEYFMTPLGLLALAETEASASNPKAAITALQDAALVAAQYEQHGALEQALRMISAHAAGSRRTDLLQPLQRAASWSSKRSATSAVAALTGAAELAIYADDLSLAEKLSSQAASGLRSPDVVWPRGEAQLSYVRALVGFAQNRGPVGISNLDAALKLMRGNAQSGAVVPSVFQTQLTLNLLADGNLTAQDAEEVLDIVLSEPGALAWQTEPLATLAHLTTASIPAFERHVELAADRQDQAAMLARIDRLQRQSFFEELPLGGRLLGWRSAVAAAPHPQAPGIQRAVDAALQRNPEIETTLERIREIVRQLEQEPLPLDERQVSGDNRKLFSELRTQSQRHENGLALQSLMRSPLPRTLPPPLDVAELQSSLRAKDAVITLSLVGQGILGVIVTPDKVEAWQIASAKPVLTKLQQLQVDLGLVRPAGKAIVDASAPNAKWQTTVTELRNLIFPDSIQALAAAAERLIVVPNRQLWYVPYELLPYQKSGLPWLSEQGVVYVPTLGSLQYAMQPQENIQRTLGVFGPLFAIDPSTNQQLGEQLTLAIRNSASINLNQNITAASPSWLKLATDQLWTAYPIEKSGWDSPVMSFGKTKQLSFGNFLETPRNAPSSIILAGLNTSLREEQLGDGRELFLPACSFLFGGAQTAVLTRWPVGGRSAHDILRRFMEERTTTPSSIALRRAILAHWPEEYLLAEEPVLLPSRRDASPLTTGAHPLIWSAYMAVGDTAPRAADN